MFFLISKKSILELSHLKLMIKILDYLQTKKLTVYPGQVASLDLSDPTLRGEVLTQVTTKSIPRPHWMKGRSFERNVEICEEMCLQERLCAGLQVGHHRK